MEDFKSEILEELKTRHLKENFSYQKPSSVVLPVEGSSTLEVPECRIVQKALEAHE